MTHFNLVKRVLLFSFILQFYASSFLIAQLSGTYTIGVGGDYASMEAAASALNSQGVNGPTTFNIFSGAYDIEVSFEQIPGTATYPVTFQSQTGNQEDVVLTGSDYFAIGLFASDNLHFKNFSIICPDFLTTPFIFHQPETVESNSIDNISLENIYLEFNGTGLTHAASVVCGQSNDVITVNNLIVKNCVFNKLAPNLWTQSAIYFYLEELDGSINTLDATFEDNTFINSGIQYRYAKALTLKRNRLLVTDFGKGIDLRYCNNITISNNFIRMETISPPITIWNFSTCDQNNTINNNSIVSNSGTPSVYFVGTTCVDFHNNTVSNNGSGPALKIDNYASSNIDYNNYQAASGKLVSEGNDDTGVTNYYSLDEVFVATGFDEHSLSVDPSFIDVANNDLHLNEDTPLLNMGTFLGSGETDIDGEPIVDPVNIGADQFPCGNLLGAELVGETYVCLGAIETYSVNMADCPTCEYSWVLEHASYVDGGGENETYLTVHWYTSIASVQGQIKLYITDTATGCTTFLSFVINQANCVCEPPVIQYDRIANEATGRIKWEHIPSADFYEIRIKRQGTNAYQSLYTENNTLDLNPYVYAGKSYDLIARSHCGKDQSVWERSAFIISDKRDKRKEDHTIRGFEISPNPAQDNVALNFSLPHNGLVEIQILNLLGQQVDQAAIQGLEGSQSYEMNLNHLNPGTYFIHIRQNDLLGTQKLIINR